MNIADIQSELNAIANSIQEQLNDFHKKTGLLVNVEVDELDVTPFGMEGRKVHYSISLRATVAEVSP